MKQLRFKEAYLVEGWATEIKKGFASKPLEEKGMMGTYEKVLFSEDMKVFSFENVVENTWSEKGVYFDFGKAMEALNKQRASYKEYLEKDIKRNQEKLKEHFNV